MQILIVTPEAARWTAFGPQASPVASQAPLTT